MAEKDINRVEANVRKMVAAKAAPNALNAYLQSEGYTPDSFSAAVAQNKRTGGIERPGNALRSFAQGLLFNFADEAEAGVRAALGQGTYDQNVAAIRSGLEDYRAENPKMAVGSEIAGSLLPAVGGLILSPFTGGSSATATAASGARIAKLAPTLLNQTKTSMLVGGTTGALSGAGSSEGGLLNRLEGGAKGGALGATIGAAIPSTVATGRAVLEKGKDVLGRTGVAAQNKADDLVLRALERDGMTPGMVTQKAKENYNKLGSKPETVADLAGANVRGKVAAAANMPGKTKNDATEFLTDRVRSQPDRLATDMQVAMGEKLENTNKLVKEIIEQRKAAADPLYKAAYEKGAIINDDAINKFLELPKFKEAYARAQRIAELEGRQLPQIYRLQPDGKGGFLRDADGLPMLGPLEKAPDLQTLDYIKRGLDDVIGSGAAKGSLGRTEIGALKKAKNEFLNRIDEVGPAEYKEARRTFAGYSEAEEALKNGRKMFDLPENDWREVSAEFAKMTDLEKQMFRRGIVDAARIRMDQKANEVGSALDVTNIFGKRQTLNRLRDVFPDDESFNLFKSNLEREAQFTQTRNQTITGSRTAPLGQEIADMNGTVLSAAEGGSLLRGNPLPAIYGTAQRFVSNRLDGITGDTAGVLGNNLLGLRSPWEISQYMENLVQRQMQVDADMARRATGRSLLSFPAGNRFGGLMGVTDEERMLPEVVTTPETSGQPIGPLLGR